MKNTPPPNPQQLQKQAQQLLQHLQISTTLTNPNIAQTLGRTRPDRQQHRLDQQTTQQLQAHQQTTNPLIKQLLNPQKIIQHLTQQTNKHNQQKTTPPLTHHTPPHQWPKHFTGRDLTPLEIMLQNTNQILLTPYQIQAQGYIKTLTHLNGNQNHIHQINGHPNTTTPPTGPQQLKATTKLAAQIRMSTLGTNPQQHPNSWHNYYNGQKYGTPTHLIGQQYPPPPITICQQTLQTLKQTLNNYKILTQVNESLNPQNPQPHQPPTHATIHQLWQTYQTLKNNPQTHP